MSAKLTISASNLPKVTIISNEQATLINKQKLLSSIITRKR